MLCKKNIPAVISAITFFIYSAHGTVLELLQYIVHLFFPESTAVALAEYLLLPVFTLLILVGASLILKRFLPALWKLVNGGR